MARLIVGALIAAVAMFVIGGIFYASGIQNVAFRTLDNVQAAAVQQALATNIGAETGTFTVPGTGTAEQTAMYGKGPIAMIHYNYRGFPASSGTALLVGFVLDLVVAGLIAFGLAGLGGRVGSVAAQRAAICFAVAAAAYIQLLDPIFMQQGWWNYLYRFVADAAALTAAGFIIARWVLPRDSTSPSATNPT